jgi:hypothetical protein
MARALCTLKRSYVFHRESAEKFALLTICRLLFAQARRMKTRNCVTTRFSREKPREFLAQTLLSIFSAAQSK